MSGLGPAPHPAGEECWKHVFGVHWIAAAIWGVFPLREQTSKAGLSAPRTLLDPCAGQAES